MSEILASAVRITLVGAENSTFRQAAQMARDTGAFVTMADSETVALEHLRRAGGDLVMMDVELDIPAFIGRLRAERIAVPLLACGIDAPAARAVAAVRGGARDYLPLPPDRELIAAAILSVARQPRQVLGTCDAMRKAVSFASSMAATAAPILIQGEPGTGKEVMARLIHARSCRPGHFLTVECHGVAPEILESELFGHEQGDFAGAVARRTGRFEEAEGGTVFLRGVDALGPSLQGRLLEMLQAAEASRTGADRNARLIASSTGDIRSMIDRGQFRADLSARLGLAEITLPPLRERGEDILTLARHFAAQFEALYELPDRKFDNAAIRVLNGFAWPGNVRELEETIHRATLLSRSDSIGVDALVHANGTRLAQLQQGPGDDMPVDHLVGHTVAEVERELILHTLERCGGNRTSASSILGISVRTMRNKLKSFVQAGIPVVPSH